MFEPAPFLADDIDGPALRETIVALARLGYCEAGVRSRLGLDDITDLDWHSLPVYHAERLKPGRPGVSLRSNH
jgi:hypothetical protein